MQLSAHFTLSELTHSQTAARMGIDNTPSAHHLDHLRALAAELEAVRVLLGNRPISVSSGYRSPELNAAVNGSWHSAHCKGLAADFLCPAYGGPLEICGTLSDSGLPFDQLIYEGTWVHFAIAAPGSAPRGEVLTAHFHRGDITTYSRGLV